VGVLRAEHYAGARLRLARGGERRKRGNGRALLEVSVKARRQAEQLREPVEHRLLELLERGRGTPEDADVVEPGAQQVGEHAGIRARGREVGEEARTLPVGEPWEHDLVQVFEQPREGLGLLGRRRRKGGADLARADAREDGCLSQPLAVALEPVDRGAAVVAEGHPAIISAGCSAGFPAGAGFDAAG
jgi:hypothetical protein